MANNEAALGCRGPSPAWRNGEKSRILGAFSALLGIVLTGFAASPLPGP